MGRSTGVSPATGPTPAASIVPVTILHHNDSHGNLAKGSFVGYTQLATLIKQERAHNPNRTLLFSLGDNIQGDSMMYYFKNAAQGTTADGTPLPPSLWQNPFIAVMNAMSYNGMVLGNHEFNFGAAVFGSTFSQAAFPLLGANMTDSGAYGINKVGLDAVVDRAGRQGQRARRPRVHPAFRRSGQPGQDRLRRPDQPPRAQLRAAEQHPRPDLR